MAGSCVRVDPRVVEFNDVTAGQVYRRTVTVTNVGKPSKKIKMGKPTLKVKGLLRCFIFDFVSTNKLYEF